MSYCVICLDGTLDERNGHLLRQEVLDLSNGFRSILIDFSAVTQADRAGLELLVATQETARVTGGQIYLCGLSHQLRTVFELNTIDRAFRIFSSRESFEQSMGSQ